MITMSCSISYFEVCSFCSFFTLLQVLNAWSKSEDKALAVRKAEDLFNDLERRYAAGETDVRADTSVYNALINCK